jgi:pimeloyl-ACP methyl ester carboxylesterase
VTAAATIEANDGTRLAYERAGEGMAVVGLHGLTASRRYVLMGSRWLERHGHDVTLYDARGHGSSTRAPSPSAYGYDVLSCDLEAVMDATGIDRAVLVGVSMGAHTLLRFALERPERVAAVVVITPGFDPDSGAEAGRRERWRALADGLRRGGVEGFVAADELDSLPERWRQTVATAVRQRLALHEHLDAVADALDIVPYSRPFEDWSALSKIAAPALVIGSRDEADPTHPLALARLYAEAIPGAQFAVEEPGASPLAWQGARVSRLVGDLGARA